MSRIASRLALDDNRTPALTEPIVSPSAPGWMLPLLASFICAACVYIWFLEPWGHDTYFHLQRLQDIEGQLSRGQFHAYFAENVAQGKGLPVWSFYSQWVYWPAILFRVLGASPLVALKIVYCVFLVVPCVGCLRLLRLHADERTALFGTLLFMTANYVIGEVFVRSAYAEFLSVAPLPLLLVSLHRTLLDGRRRDGVALVLLTAVMMLFHLLSFMNAVCILTVYAAYVVTRWRLPPRHLLRLVPLLVLALGLTAFYWLPAVIETRYVLGAKGVPTPLNRTFLTIQRYLKFISITNLGFVLTLIAGLVAGGLLLRLRRDNRAGRFAGWPLLAGIAIYVFLTLRISEPLYTHFPLLASTLWVWRVLFPLTLLVVIFVTSNLDVLSRRLRSDAALAAISVLAVLQAAIVVGWDTAQFFSAGRTAPQEIERMLGIANSELRGFGVDEYLPDPQKVPRPETECRSVRVVSPHGPYERGIATAHADAGDCIHIPRYWNVRYAASINGEPVPVFANAAQEVLIVAGARSGAIEVWARRPGYVTFSALLSLCALVLLVIRTVLSQRVVSRLGYSRQSHGTI